MAYPYFCSHCGKKLTQETVLFDMQYLLTQDDTRQFHILKFRMTQAELKAFLAGGAPEEYGYRKFPLTLADVMGIVGNKNNLDNEYVAQLTLEEIGEYLEYSSRIQPTSGGESDWWEGFEDEEEELEMEAEPYVKPWSITMLEKKVARLVDECFVKDLLSKDLSVLRDIFAENEFYEFQLREDNDVDNDGNDVLEGYCVKLVGGALPIDARICPNCGEKVFRHAGTAPQKVVTFIGPPRSGKSSVIMSLTDYALSYMNLGGGSRIWDGCQIIDSVAGVELLQQARWFHDELKRYGKGMALLGKHFMGEYRLDCVYDYIPTFRLKNWTDNSRYILTFLALPSQIYLDCGDIRWHRVRKYFPAALTSDAFVMCFDPQSLSGKDGTQTPAQLVADVCNWTDQFQRMRAQENGVDTYVPTMILFTKCAELEDTDAPDAPVPPIRHLLPPDRMYLLKSEKQRIASNAMYRFVIDRFSSYGQLDKAYHAMMRCSAYGYSPPHIWDIEDAQREGKTIDCHPPKPKNIDLLMRWLLSVTGCIPVEASFTRGIHDTPYRLENFSITRPQLRRQNPLEQHLMEESMARCALFENPGYFDRGFVPKHGQRVSFFDSLWREYLRRPDTNDRE